MKTEVQIKEYIREIVTTNQFGVLATESESQPHACLIAVTASEDLTQIVFATYKKTRKYYNLTQNQNVCILFESKHNEQGIIVLSAFGKAKELTDIATNELIQAHLLSHPELNTFLQSTESVFFQVAVDSYQLVLGVDDIYWWKDIC